MRLSRLARPLLRRSCPFTARALPRFARRSKPNGNADSAQARPLAQTALQPLQPLAPERAVGGAGAHPGESAEIAGDQNALLQHDVEIAVRAVFQVLHGR